jgi:hypothetical protein
MIPTFLRMPLGDQMRGETIGLDLGVLDPTWLADIITNEVFSVDEVIDVVNGDLRLAIGQQGDVLAVQEEAEYIIER